jgi:hypothetical protein
MESCRLCRQALTSRSQRAFPLHDVWAHCEVGQRRSCTSYSLMGRLRLLVSFSSDQLPLHPTKPW